MPLVITRYPGQRIFIGENIELVVTQIQGHQVRISVDAPGLLIERPSPEEDLRDREESKRIDDERRRAYYAAFEDRKGSR